MRGRGAWACNVGNVLLALKQEPEPAGGRSDVHRHGRKRASEPAAARRNRMATDRDAFDCGYEAGCQAARAAVASDLKILADHFASEIVSSGLRYANLPACLPFCSRHQTDAPRIGGNDERLLQ